LHHLHGGSKGFHNVVWKVCDVADSEIHLRYTSPDTEDGFPGRLETLLSYKISDDNELKVAYSTHADKTTVINLTHHSFFNLTGDFRLPITDHFVQIAADSITSINEDLIPDGKLMSVQDTPFDFRTPRRIRDVIDASDLQLEYGKGFDHNFVLNKSNGIAEDQFAARVLDPLSGRIMEVYTNEPGLQFYSGNFLDGSDVGKGGIAYNYRTAFCLETQHFPDSPHNPQFPSTILEAGEEYHSVCIYKFSSDKEKRKSVKE
jgi:aldose 1-epimerase